MIEKQINEGGRATDTNASGPKEIDEIEEMQKWVFKITLERKKKEIVYTPPPIIIHFKYIYMQFLENYLVFNKNEF